jgi:hypothetical protein
MVACAEEFECKKKKGTRENPLSPPTIFVELRSFAVKPRAFGAPMCDFGA